MERKRAERKILKQLYSTMAHAAKHMVGYPHALLFDYSLLMRFFEFNINNVGDPYSPSGYSRMNTLAIEKRVINRFAELFHAPKKDFWGYVTNGGTEGNLYGTYVARELYPDGILFFSDQVHYSIYKNAKILRMPIVVVKSQPNGEIDYEALETALAKHRKKGTPIFLANIGTTMKGAIDDVVRVHKILDSLKIKKHYIHCDAACFGMILPFLPGHRMNHFDFRAKIDSIAISGHKVIGTPMPCGVVLTKKSHANAVSHFVEYVAVPDMTMSGSRNGLTPLFLWHEMIFSEEEKFKKKIRECICKADDAIAVFAKYKIKAWRNQNSIIVIFPRPSEKTARKWQLAVEGDIAHMITLPHVTHRMINQVVADVAADLGNT